MNIISQHCVRIVPHATEKIWLGWKVHYSLNIGMIMSRIPVLEARGFVDDKNGMLDITIYSVATNIVDEKESISWY